MQRYPIIVIDGPDGTGKSTLAKHICKLFGAKYRHLTYRFRDRMPLYHTAALELSLRESEHQPVVIDRWWPSELAYAAEFRGGSPWALQEARMLDRVALRHGINYVFCLPRNRDEYLSSFDRLKTERPEMFDNMSGIYQRFENVMTWLGPRRNVHRYDRFTDGDDMDMFAATIYGGGMMIRPDPSIRKIAGRVDGRAKLLIVCNQDTTRARRNLWPAFNMDDWLTLELEKLSVPEDRLTWINLHDKNGDRQWTITKLDWLKKRTHSTICVSEGVPKGFQDFYLGIFRHTPVVNNTASGLKLLESVVQAAGAVDPRKERIHAAQNLSIL